MASFSSSALIATVGSVIAAQLADNKLAVSNGERQAVGINKALKDGLTIENVNVLTGSARLH